MSAQPAGWYPDPFAAEPGPSRYWDGERWTTQVQSPLPEHSPSAHGGRPLDGHGATRWGGDERAGGHRERDGAHPERPWERAPADRQGELASWGRRLAAYLIDVIPIVFLGMLVLTMTGVTDAMNRAIESADASALDAATAMLSPTSGTGIAVTLVNLLFVAAYNVGMHVTRGQTIGKMLVGIRVRMADEDRHPTLRAAGMRCAVQFGPNLLNGVPLLGFLASAFNLADHLWPLWDPQRQAIHDKAAGTVVVRTR